MSTDSDRRPGTLWVMARRAVGLLAACAICLIVLLRTVALDSDPYARLSWSSGLLTDEGYYIHNARNLVLFGTERTDEFNNMLIMPTLHFVQVAVFRQWGPGVVSARMISVVCSLFAILVLYAAARRAFGAKVAGFAALFVGLDHTNLLYNRMALMDTPGEMLLVFALYAWVRGMPIRRDGAVSRGWLVACGALLAFAFVTRGLAGIAIPAAALAVWLTSRHAGRALHTGSERQADPSPAVTLGTTFVPMACGLATVLAAYLVFWYAPHKVELARINHYYLWGQLVPSSGQRLALNIANAWFGDERGAAPFLMRHTPIQVLLLYGWVVYLFRRWRGYTAEQSRSAPLADCFNGPTAVFVLCWLGCAALFLSLASYSPSRYYLLFYPALALASAFTLANMRAVVEGVIASRLAVFLLGTYIGCHAALLAWHHASISSVAAVGVAAIGGGALLLLLRAAVQTRPSWTAGYAKAAPTALLLCWAGINGFYLSDWLAHLTYHQRDASRWLAANLPPDTVMIGDVAPGVCLYNGLMAISVIPNLCNDREPIERFRTRPRAVAILDGVYKERWWTDHYPRLIASENRIVLFPRIVRFPVGVYRVGVEN